MKNLKRSNQRQKLTAAHLTSKQALCLALLCYDGLSRDEIGLRLGMTRRAVSYRIAAACRRLDRVALHAKIVRIEFQAGLLPMDPSEIDKLDPREIKAVW